MQTLIKMAIFVVVVGAGVLVYMGVVAVDPEEGVSMETQQPEEDTDHYAEGGQAFGLGNYETAINHYRVAIERDPLHPSAPIARYRIAKSFEDLNKLDKAITAYRAFAARHPEHQLARKAEERAAYLDGVVN